MVKYLWLYRNTQHSLVYFDETSLLMAFLQKLHRIQYNRCQRDLVKSTFLENDWQEICLNSNHHPYESQPFYPLYDQAQCSFAYLARSKMMMHAQVVSLCLPYVWITTWFSYWFSMMHRSSNLCSLSRPSGQHPLQVPLGKPYVNDTSTMDAVEPKSQIWGVRGMKRYYLEQIIGRCWYSAFVGIWKVFVCWGVFMIWSDYITARRRSARKVVAFRSCFSGMACVGQSDTKRGLSWICYWSLV